MADRLLNRLIGVTGFIPKEWDAVMADMRGMIAALGRGTELVPVTPFGKAAWNLRGQIIVPEKSGKDL